MIKVEEIRNAASLTPRDRRRPLQEV